MNRNYNNKGYNQNNMNGANYPDMPRDSEEYMYPEVYRKFAPIADRMIRDMEKQYGDIILSEDILQQMSDEAVRRAGAGADMPPQFTPKTLKTDDAIPAVNMYGMYDRGRGGRHWSDYDRGALSDIFKILFLQQIFGRRRPRWGWR